MGDWTCEADVLRSGYTWDDKPDDFEGTVLFAIYEAQSYEGSSYVLLWDAKEEKLMEWNSGHCSCNGLGWDPTETSIAVIKHRIETDKAEPMLGYWTEDQNETFIKYIFGLELLIKLFPRHWMYI